MDRQEEESMELIFHIYSETRDGEMMISVPYFLQIIKECGLRENDQRLLPVIKALKSYLAEDRTGFINIETFKKCINKCTFLLRRALQGDFVIPDFQVFTSTLKDFYHEAKLINDGQLSDYIPQLERLSPDKWGVAVCTVDGQRFSIGDCKDKWCLQSCCKCVNYAMILDERGGDVVHKFIGQEPSGRRYHDMSMNLEGKPYNALINQGGIMGCALMKVRDRYKQAAGNEHIGFDLPTFLSEKETGHRNYALAYHMFGKKAFPPDTVLNEVLDLYFQLCSVEVTCESASVIAATLANGGICPTTEQRVFNETAVRDTLSVMNSCGMSDYTGRFAFEVGLPAKSGISGGIFIIIPNVMGICTWSPLLDNHSNSVRGVKFCKRLVEEFNFHYYDSLINIEKNDPRLSAEYVYGLKYSRIFTAAASGDLSALKRYCQCGDMEAIDYDQRTALHVAAAEGHYNVVKYLLSVCKVNPNPKDRWGNIPIDDAEKSGNHHVVALLKHYSELERELKKKPTS
ncbi:uncharacterized protein TRIADDRAFT_61194 [Trichoplax adhaerens]|uniref:glutaminase n=1 Tax=Trichoplax adhaerens TaxID=10228 RepID=B3SAA5_TRIAD|nr:hypothetical protein TRIADDRAFT_61194 [Trichoplax adhaerens]EDV20482.1 hypothetical protein TRIADDRAFT_61194 [Trichoplax adhaerens]|eukprot:XP_002117176.1 hypothetical protein TRIADDRAFT_61194 [Trichoplax adhaerens]